MTSKLTRERLQEIAEDGFLKHGESKELARMALVAMDSEPVAEITEDLGRLFVKIHYQTTLKAGDKLYRHAQPAPAVPVLTRADFENWRQKTFALSPSYLEKDAKGVYTGTLVHDLYVAWDGCRAAMLAAAQQELKK